MRQISQTSLLPCTTNAFWTLLLDPAYARALFLDGLGFRGFEVLESGTTSRKLRIVPAMNLPSVLAKIVGDAFAYEEHGVLDRARGVWTWEMIRPLRSPLPEIVATRCTMRVEPAGDGQCKRTEEIVIEGKLFGLGRVIEAAAEKETRAAWAKELPFLTRWLAEHREGDP